MCTPSASRRCCNHNQKSTNQMGGYAPTAASFTQRTRMGGCWAMDGISCSALGQASLLVGHHRAGLFLFGRLSLLLDGLLTGQITEPSTEFGLAGQAAGRVLFTPRLLKRRRVKTILRWWNVVKQAVGYLVEDNKSSSVSKAALAAMALTLGSATVPA